MGKFSNIVERFVIVDCRYPYEYEGGHIKVRRGDKRSPEDSLVLSFLYGCTYPLVGKVLPSKRWGHLFERQGLHRGGVCHPGPGLWPDLWLIWQTAVNLPLERDAETFLLQSPIMPCSLDKRIILIFHCEFSSERGPRM